jgi:hypothetical protein
VARPPLREVEGISVIDSVTCELCHERGYGAVLTVERGHTEICALCIGQTFGMMMHVAAGWLHNVSPDAAGVGAGVDVSASGGDRP